MTERLIEDSFFQEDLPSHELLGTQPVILLSGAMASGKEMGSRFLEEVYGFSHITISDILKSEASRRGIVPPFLREDLREIAQELVKEGPDFMVQQLTEEVDKASSEEGYKGTIIDGLRLPQVSTVLTREKNVVGIWIEADSSLRKKRFIERGATPEQINEFDEADRIENEAMAPIRNISHYILSNDGRPEDFFKGLEAIVYYNFGLPPLASSSLTIYP